MMNFARIQQRLRDESGMSYVFIGMGMMAFLSASMLAIDVGMLMTARNQAQNSADAGALAGAVALGFDDFNDRSATGPAVKHAISASKNNDVMAGDVDVIPSDVEFLNDDDGQPTRVKVTVYRHPSRGNPMSTLIAKYFGMAEAGVKATATAEVSPADSMTCVKPFTIPDKWKEVGSDAPFDPSTSNFEMYSNKNQPLPPSEADVYIPFKNADGTPNANFTGYNMRNDRGTRLMIRAGTGNNISPSFYFSLALNNDTGGSTYEWNIANCNQTIMHWGEPLLQEPGNMMGPTVHGIEELIAKDPYATWNETEKRVQGSRYTGQSPRVFPIPLYDPKFYEEGKHNGRNADLKVANWIGFFAESVVGNNIYGRITPIGGIRSGADVPDGLFPIAIRLVK
jgi:Flp pilus assembly protein TadG